MILFAETKTIDDVLSSVFSKISPLWPLKDFVAVNPFLGFSGQSFLETRQTLRKVRPGDLLMSRDYFRDRVEQGLVSNDDVLQAFQQCCLEYPASFSSLTVEEVLGQITSPSESNANDDEAGYLTVAEAIDCARGSRWSSIVVDEVSRHCAAHYDEGQAIWQSPWKHLSLFEAWKQVASIDRRFEKLGVTGFREFVEALPDNPREAIESLLQDSQIPQEHWESLLLREIYSVAGWASYVCGQLPTTEVTSGTNDLIGLLAMRLAYDVALDQSDLFTIAAHQQWIAAMPVQPQDVDATSEGDAMPSLDVRSRYVCHVAAEIAYRRPLLSNILASTTHPILQKTPAVQMVFCIDVRSERIRRHLESVSDEIQTFGFAGFFGLPMKYVALGESDGPAQCPVLLKPGFTVHETVTTTAGVSEAVVKKQRSAKRLMRGVWQSFQQSATSCFSYVESLGWTYAASLLASTLRLAKGDHSRFDGLPQSDQHQLGPTAELSLSFAKQVDLAEGILRNLGLTKGFAPLVVLCGHESETLNNPYRASLDCGACGGHSGESNARVAAKLLNDLAIRCELSNRGIAIGKDVRFIGAVHYTTTDKVTLFDAQTVRGEGRHALHQLHQWLELAAKQCRAERALSLHADKADDLLQRAIDWSEVRPEWGLAGNAAFVVAPRWRTAHLKLDGRVFMHSYDHHSDSQGKVLELIMTAPMVVTNWINLQYYASTVDNKNYGSGNKAIHNVVGQLGVFLGNGGDLKTGLPWQSVHNGTEFQHEPLRLSVIIEAPRTAMDEVLDNHANVRDLVSNGWLTLIAIDNDRVYQYMGHEGWMVV